MKKKRKNKRKLNKKRFLVFLIILFSLFFFIYYIFNVKIKNIYIKGNYYLTDQEIIDIAGIQDYPTSINNLTYNIEKKLKKNIYIKDVKVKKSFDLSEITIEIKENYPLFYYQVEDKYILYDGTKVDKKFTVPTVINQIPNTIYNKFLNKIKDVDIDILSRMSEVKYDPNDVDDERFIIYMNDDNYVYLTIRKFLNINKYIEVINSFENKKGILHLDSGEYFDVFN